MTITTQQAELARDISNDLLKFISYKRHELRGLTREQVVDKYIKTYTRHFMIFGIIFKNINILIGGNIE